VNLEGAFWFVFGFSLMGAALLIHAAEYAAPRLMRWAMARVRRERPRLELVR
jgi:hypothetical protein